MVSYTISGRGQGLFSTSIAKDLSLLLRVLTDPSDLYALIGLLRSPWIGIDDQELTQKLAIETPPTSAGLLFSFQPGKSALSIVEIYSVEIYSQNRSDIGLKLPTMMCCS